eukprot:scaffold42342_cov52-Attheya_sp.AAC.3
MSHPTDDGRNISPSATKSVWRLKTKKEFISSLTEEEKQSKGILDPDPWKRWTAYQASNHPFITGSSSRRRPAGSDASASRQHISNGANGRPDFDIYWAVPWDPAICRRKLLCVQKARDKQQAMRRNNGYTGTSSSSLLSQQLRPQSIPTDGIQNLSTDQLRALHQSEASKDFSS